MPVQKGLFAQVYKSTCTPTQENLHRRAIRGYIPILEPEGQKFKEPKERKNRKVSYNGIPGREKVTTNRSNIIVSPHNLEPVQNVNLEVCPILSSKIFKKINNYYFILIIWGHNSSDVFFQNKCKNFKPKSNPKINNFYIKKSV